MWKGDCNYNTAGWQVSLVSFCVLELLQILLPGVCSCAYNHVMKKIAKLILVGILVFVGCQSEEDREENHYDEVSREIEQLKAESEAQAQVQTISGDNIRIVVNMLTTSKQDYFAVDALWRYVSRGFVVAKRPELYVDSGIKIGVGTGDFRARLDIVKQHLKSSEEAEIFLVLADGYSGYINVGTEITVPRFYYFDRYYKAVDYEFRRAGKSLEVTARKIPERPLVNLKITPVFSKFLNDGGDLEMTELSTHITVMSGQPVVIGGTTNEQEDAGKALFRYEKGTIKKQTLIIATAYFQ